MKLFKALFGAKDAPKKAAPHVRKGAERNRELTVKEILAAVERSRAELRETARRNGLI